MDLLSVTEVFQPFDGLAGPVSIIPPGPAQLRQAVYSRLTASPAITALVGPRIYFGALPQTYNVWTNAAISYGVISRPYGHTLSGADGTSQARVQITAHAASESLCDQITQAVRNSFDGFVGTIAGVQVTACILDNELDISTPPMAGTDQWTYSIASDYQINHRVLLPSALS
jgi:hypothetical protein